MKVQVPLNSIVNRQTVRQQPVLLNNPTFQNNYQFFWNGVLSNTQIKEYAIGTFISNYERAFNIENGKLYIDNKFVADLKPILPDPYKIIGVPYINSEFSLDITFKNKEIYSDEGHHWTFPWDIDHIVPTYSSTNKTLLVIEANNHHYLFNTNDNSYVQLGDVNNDGIALISNNYAVIGTQGEFNWAYFNLTSGAKTIEARFNYAYLNIDNNILFTRDNIDQKVNSNIIYGLLTSNLSTVSSSGRIYSFVAGPGYVYWYVTANNSTITCNYYDFNKISYSGNCTMTHEDDVYKPILDYNRRVETAYPSSSADTATGYVSDIAGRFNWKTGNLVITYGTHSAAVISDNLICPANQFETIYCNNKYLFELNGKFYSLKSANSYKIIESTAYTYQINDGSIIIETKDSYNYYAPVKFNPNYQPLNLLCGNIFTAQADSVESIFSIASSNNANYELSDNRNIGGIWPPMILTGELTVNFNQNNYITALFAPTLADIYWGQTGTEEASVSQEYKFSIPLKTNIKLLDAIYPDPGSDVILPIPGNSTYTKSRGHRLMFQWSDLISSIGGISGSKSYNFYFNNSILYEGKIFFYLQGLNYYFDGKSIWGIAFDGSLLVDQQFIINAEGLLYCGCSSEMALFYSKEDATIYGFTGGRTAAALIPMSQVSEIIEADYTQNGDIFIFRTAKEIFIMRNKIMFNLPIESSYIDAINGGVVADNIIYKIPVDKNAAFYPFYLETSWLGGEQSSVFNFNKIDARFITEDRSPINIDFIVVAQLDSGIKKQHKQRFRIDTWNDYNQQLLEIPVGDIASSIKIIISSNDRIFLEYLAIDVGDNIQSRPVKKFN